MKNLFLQLLLIGFLQSQFHLFSVVHVSPSAVYTPEPAVKEAAFRILKTKCNVCHKRQNPFKIFSRKNMNRHAPKIYKQVFVYKRMPKGNKVKLTEEEYQTLKDWLKTKNLF